MTDAYLVIGAIYTSISCASLTQMSISHWRMAVMRVGGHPRLLRWLSRVARALSAGLPIECLHVLANGWLGISYLSLAH